MIGQIRYPDGRDFTCDDCKNIVARFKNYNELHKAGWALANGRKKCYCSACAPKHRHVGRAGADVPASNLSWVPAGMEQTTIDLK